MEKRFVKRRKKGAARFKPNRAYVEKSVENFLRDGGKINRIILDEKSYRDFIIGNERPVEEGYDVARVPTGILANADRDRLRILREENGRTDIGGKKVDIRTLPKEIRFLEKRVGKDEVLISVPKSLIGDMKK